VSIGSAAAPDRAIEQLRTWFAANSTPPTDPPTPAHVEGYFIHTNDEIDLAKLDDQTVFELAIQQTEPFIATSALDALAQRRGYHGRDAAEAILMQAVWDDHHTAYAMSVLYKGDPRRAIELMTPHLASDNPILVDELVDIVLDHAADFAKPARREFATKLAARIAETAPGMHTDRERRAELLSRYGAKES
jgi:hypothetical protein